MGAEVCPSGAAGEQRVKAPCSARLGGDGKPNLLFQLISSHLGQCQPAGTLCAIFSKGRKPLGACVCFCCQQNWGIFRLHQ